MATKLVEYSPGRWLKVVDGRIVGRATEEEVAAWIAAGGATSTELTPPDVLDLDLDLSPPEHRSEPGRFADVSRRPAFERRGRRIEPTAPPGPPGARPRSADEIDVDMTIETALLRESARRRRSAPKAEEGPVTVRRRLPALDLPPPAQTRTRPDKSDTEETSLPRRSAPRQPESTSPGAPTSAPAAPTPPAPAPAEAEPLPAGSGEGPSYWWIYNAQRQPVEAFLKEWLPRYKAKFGREATFVLCHADDLDAVLAMGLQADVSPLLQPGHFYLSHTGNGSPAEGKRRTPDSE